MFDDENIGTTLAYTKSPKTSKRTSFQDELKKVVSARKSRHSTKKDSDDSDYSDKFEESDDDDSVKNDFNEKSINEKTKRTLSNNFSLPDDEDKPQKVSFLKSKKLIDSYEDHEWEHKNNENKPPANQDRRSEGGEQKSSFFSEHQKYNKSIIQDEGDAKPVPIPKPRDYKMKSSQSEEGIGLSASDESFKPIPLQRNVLRRSNHVEELRTDDTSSSSRSSSSLSAPSSMTKLSGKSSENIALFETVGSEGQNQNRPPSKPELSFADDNPGGSSLTVSPEGTFPVTKELSELEHHCTSQAKDQGSRSPSVLELMMATVYEQSKQQLIENPPLESSECETRMPHKSRQKMDYDSSNSSGHDAETRNTAEQQKHKAIQEKNLKNKKETSGRVNSPSTRCLNTTLHHTKKPTSARNRTYNTAKSRYLGTLTVLDNKHLLKSASDPEAADTLRAAVYQDWLEKKKIFLQELQKIKKIEEEKEREKRRSEGGAKKEDASASFQAWNAVKTKELKKNVMKLKEEEENKRKELEQMAEKKEESKKAAFEKWKEDKEEHLKEKIRKEKQAEMAKKRNEEQAVAEKKKESKMAFCKWSEKKEDVLKSKKKEKLQEEKEKQEKERAEKEWQEKKAMEEYERWLGKKERNDKIVKKQKKLQVILEEEPIPPWSPPGRTVPMGK